MTSFYDGIDMTRVMYGENARHVPAWMYVQDQGPGVVGLVGASEVFAPHPLRYGSSRTHQLIVGEIIVRPHLVIATDALRGDGPAYLYLGEHDFPRMLADGEVIAGSEATLRRIIAEDDPEVARILRNMRLLGGGLDDDPFADLFPEE